MTSPLVRTTRLATAYRRLLTTADAPQYAAEVDEHYSPMTLATLLSRGDVELRRASAMALGLLGNSRSIEPLGRALSPARPPDPSWASWDWHACWAASPGD